MPYLYPRLYVLHNLGGLHGVALDSDDEASGAAAHGPPDAMPTRPAAEPASLTHAQLAYRVVLPPTTYPSIEQLAPHGLYLLEAAAGLWLWVGADVDEEIGTELWGQEAWKHGGPLHPLPRARTEWSLRVWTIIEAIRARRPPYLPLTVVGPRDGAGGAAGEAARDRFAAQLVEDRVGSARSYVDLLCSIHTSIQARMAAAASH